MSRDDQQLVTIEREGNVISCRSPYHPAFIARAKELHGRYDDGLWLFPTEQEEGVRSICREIYGTDGTGDQVLVTLQVELGQMRLVGRPDFFLAGRRIAYRPQRDSRVRLGPRVTVIRGGFPASGGSIERPRLQPSPDTVVEVMDVPQEAAQAALREHPDLVRVYTASPAHTSSDPVLQVLEGERAKIQQLLDDLDDQIDARRSAVSLPAF
jgi:hypothetical protein